MADEETQALSEIHRGKPKPVRVPGLMEGVQMRSLLGVIVLICLVATPAMSQDETDYMITPGYAIGGISVGMDLGLALTVLGRPPVSRAATGPSAIPIPAGAREYLWPNGLVIMAAHNIVYVVELVENAHYFLPNQLHNGVSRSDVRAAMGKPRRVFSTGASTGWAYDDKGVAFYFRQDRLGPDKDAVVRIDVYKPR